MPHKKKKKSLRTLVQSQDHTEERTDFHKMSSDLY